MIKNTSLVTIITTILATLALFIVKYILNQSFDLVDIVIFAAVFGVGFFLFQTYFSKKVKKKKKK